MENVKGLAIFLHFFRQAFHIFCNQLIISAMWEKSLSHPFHPPFTGKEYMSRPVHLGVRLKNLTLIPSSTRADGVARVLFFAPSSEWNRSVPRETQSTHQVTLVCRPRDTGLRFNWHPTKKLIRHPECSTAESRDLTPILLYHVIRVKGWRAEDLKSKLFLNRLVETERGKIGEWVKKKV